MLVAQLTLTRGTAGLALARREFKTLTERAYAPTASSLAEVPAVVPRPRTGSGLPRRPVGHHNELPEVDEEVVPPGWLALVGQPYVTNDAALDRIIGTLRHL
jgi:hypothetical protein